MFRFSLKNQVYLDYNATTPPDKEALRAAQKASNCWGNPSSIHQMAAESKKFIMGIS